LPFITFPTVCYIHQLTMVRVKSTLANLALVSVVGASPIAQAVDFGRGATECGLAPEDPKSWAASGAEKLLGEWLDKNGPGKIIGTKAKFRANIRRQSNGSRESAEQALVPTPFRSIVLSRVPTAALLQNISQPARNMTVR
jgi:hypothetical protein